MIEGEVIEQAVECATEPTAGSNAAPPRTAVAAPDERAASQTEAMQGISPSATAARSKAYTKAELGVPPAGAAGWAEPTEDRAESTNDQTEPQCATGPTADHRAPQPGLVPEPAADHLTAERTDNPHPIAPQGGPRLEEANAAAGLRRVGQPSPAQPCGRRPDRMNTSRRIEANRANARGSTGPRTNAGKTRTSRNARRHGLNVPVDRDSALSIEVEELTRRLVGDVADAGLAAQAYAFAEAAIDLARVERVRLELTRRFLALSVPDACVEDRTARALP